MQEVHLPSAAYELFEQAMRGKKQIFCSYHGYSRELCPIILGHTQGQEKALAYQIGGNSKSGLPPGGEWCCLLLSEVSDAQLRNEPWRRSRCESVKSLWPKTPRPAFLGDPSRHPD